jgi:hypothetical protein
MTRLHFKKGEKGATPLVKLAIGPIFCPKFVAEVRTGFSKAMTQELQQVNDSSGMV